MSCSGKESKRLRGIYVLILVSIVLPREALKRADLPTLEYFVSNSTSPSKGYTNTSWSIWDVLLERCSTTGRGWFWWERNQWWWSWLLSYKGTSIGVYFFFSCGWELERVPDAAAFFVVATQVDSRVAKGFFEIASALRFEIWLVGSFHIVLVRQARGHT